MIQTWSYSTHRVLVGFTGYLARCLTFEAMVMLGPTRVNEVVSRSFGLRLVIDLQLKVVLGESWT